MPTTKSLDLEAQSLVIAIVLPTHTHTPKPLAKSSISHYREGGRRGRYFKMFLLASKCEALVPRSSFFPEQDKLFWVVNHGIFASLDRVHVASLVT